MCKTIPLIHYLFFSNTLKQSIFLIIHTIIKHYSELVPYKYLFHLNLNHIEYQIVTKMCELTQLCVF